MKNISQIDISEYLSRKIRIIQDLFFNKKSLISYSGGIDSSLILFMAKEFGLKTKAILIHSPLTPSQEIKQSEQFSRILSVPLEIVEINMLEIPEIRLNSIRRCYYCKQKIISKLNEIATREEFDLIVDGTNYSDLSLVRPGLQALKESNVLSPLAIAKFSKDEIIRLTTLLNLPSQNISSQACLASRIPYKVEITEKLLYKIDNAEQYLRELVGDSSIPIRVRIHLLPPTKKIIAKIESNDFFFNLIQNPEIREQINSYFKKIGFVFVTIDLCGFSSGSMHNLL